LILIKIPRSGYGRRLAGRDGLLYPLAYRSGCAAAQRPPNPVPHFLFPKVRGETIETIADVTCVTHITPAIHRAKCVGL